MALQRCSNGHFYDATQYPCCPICGAQRAGDQMAGAPLSLPAVGREEPVRFIYTDPYNNHAGFWKRVVANVMDNVVIFFLVYLPICAIYGGTALRMQDEDDGMAFLMFMVVLFFVVVWLYYAAMETSSYQGTLGKLALGLKVTDMEGRRISFGRATGRFFAGALSRCILYIGYMMAGWTERKQAFHDIITGCLVENK